MACHSCGVEFFTQGPIGSEAPTLSETKSLYDSSDCPLKNSSSKCLYTAQGVFMCVTDARDMGVVDNESMMMEPLRDSSKFKSLAPW